MRFSSVSVGLVVALALAGTALAHGKPHFGGFRGPPGPGAAQRGDTAAGDGAAAVMTRSQERKCMRLGFVLAQVADTDEDGAVSADEWAVFLDSLTVDENGVVDMDALVALLPARPDGEDHDVDKLTTILDVDGDGAVELEDLEALYAALDVNADGELMSFETHKRHRLGRKAKRHGGQIVLLADADASGDVTADEWDAFLASLNADDDGVIAADTLLALLPEPDGGFPDDAADKLTRHLDRDKDGALEIEDLEELFAQLDADEDGALSADEIPHCKRATDDTTDGTTDDTSGGDTTTGTTADDGGDA